MNILLLDTAFAAAPIYNGLIEAGHDVWVMGNRPDDLLARVAGERWIDQNYRDVEAVRGHVARFGIERVVPGCTDVSIETVVELEAGAHLRDDAQTNLALGHKAQFRALCELLDLPSPRVVDPQSFPRPGRFICKPVDAFSGRGITVFDGADAGALASAVEAARAASRSGDALIEPYVGDRLFSCSGFLRDGAFTQVFFVREGSSVNPYAVDTSNVVYDFPSDHASALTSSLERLARHLRLKDGLLHTQFILSEHGPMIVEVSRRCPGDLYPLLIEYSTGFRFAAAYAAAFAGYAFESQPSTRRHVLRHTVTADSRTEYGGLVFAGAAPVIAFYPIARMGEELLPRQGNRAGLLFTEYASAAALEDAYASIIARENYHVQGALKATNSD